MLKPYLEPVILSHRELIEILAEAEYFNSLLREWKAVKYAYQLKDGNYLFSMLPYVPVQSHGPIDFDLIEKEARALRGRLNNRKAWYIKRLSS